MSEQEKPGATTDDQPVAAAEDVTTDTTMDETFDAAEDTTIDEKVDAPIDVAPQARTGVFVTWLALFAALSALILAGVGLLGDRGPAGQDPAATAAVDAVSSSMRSVQDALASLQQNVNAVANELAARDTDMAAIERRFSDRLRQIEAVSGRMSALESTVSSLQGISTGARDAWLLAEAEYYMQIANAQLQLAGNPQLARRALGLADERILQLANPALTAVRRALANELRALAVMEKPDTAGVALTLASLASVVDSLPLQAAPGAPKSSIDAPDAELTGASRALASLQSAIGSAVSVRRVDEAVRPFIAPEAQYFLRANLALQLQAARLAMLRNEAQIFEHSLDDAASWLTEYYDLDSTPVQSALQTIADIRGAAVSVAIPDISASLRLLRQFNALADATSRSNATRAEATEEIAAEPQQ